jgi:hypothetical protein
MRLVIDNTVQVPVKFETNNNGKGKAFNFNLTCKRLSQEELNAIVKDEEALIKDVMKDITTGWQNQTLVVDEDGTPCPFSDASFDMMLSLKGIGLIAWQSYQKEVGAKTKN